MIPNMTIRKDHHVSNIPLSTTCPSLRYLRNMAKHGPVRKRHADATKVNMYGVESKSSFGLSPLDYELFRAARQLGPGRFKDA